MRSRLSNLNRKDSSFTSSAQIKASTSALSSAPLSSKEQKRTNMMLPTSSSTSTSTNSSSSSSPQWLVTTLATIYVLSGATQPLLMTLVKSAGLGDPTCQLYMLFYYIGPSLVSFTLCCQPTSSTDIASSTDTTVTTTPTSSLILKASSIAIIDIFAQSMNYTGSTMAGPTIFAIIYSSVTIWTALYSYILLSRKLNTKQWCGVITVFCGLLITSFNSVSVGEDVWNGTILILIGSSLHALTYVLSEIIMTKEKLSLQLNCSIQGMVAVTIYFIWQLVYTKRNYHKRIEIPMMEHNTTVGVALLILSSLSVSNLIHATTFFYTLKHFPGGSTSAGVMKGLQAVLVFLFSSFVYCHRIEGSGGGGGGTTSGESYGGEEMCFTYEKFISLIVVLTGVLIFAIATDGLRTTRRESSNSGGGNRNGDNNLNSLPRGARKKGYHQISSIKEEEEYDEEGSNHNIRIA